MVSIPESSTSESSPPQEASASKLSNDASGNSIRTRALTARQERRLVEYVEDMFLDIMRNYKKRDHPSTILANLHSYLRATHTLLSLILQIPPVAPNQAALRIALLLRFTSETLSAISHYPRPVLAQSRTRQGNPEDGAETLRELLNWLDELDRGWHTVLCSQAWDPNAHEGVDVNIDADNDSPNNDASVSHSNWQTGAQMEVDEDEDFSPASLGINTNALSQTDRARLRSLLLSGISALEEWLEGVQPPRTTSTRRANVSSSQTNGDQGSELELDEDEELFGSNGSRNEVDDLEITLEHLGLQQAFDDLFSRTLTSMGELGGEVLSPGEELEME